MVVSLNSRLEGNREEEGRRRTKRNSSQFKNNCFTENEKRFRGGLVSKAHGWLYHSTLGSRAKTEEEKVADIRGMFIKAILIRGMFIKAIQFLLN